MNTPLDTLKARLDQALEALEQQHEVQVQGLMARHEAQLAALRLQFDQQLEGLRSGHRVMVQAVRSRHEAQLASMAASQAFMPSSGGAARH